MLNAHFIATFVNVDARQGLFFSEIAQGEGFEDKLFEAKFIDLWRISRIKDLLLLHP